MPHDPAQRLQKALAHLGLASRREVEAWIRAGRLTVNGETAALGTRVRESDRIRLDGRLVRQRPAVSQQIFICHRSPGEPLAAASAWDASAPDSTGNEVSNRDALVDRLPRTGGRRFIAVSPMPQHDGGLELVTSDGEIAERLQRAVRRLDGEFSIRLRGELPESALASVRAGALDNGRSLEVLDCAEGGGEGANRWYTLS
ncbi:MAG: S4 domain-containing protein, partial [Steroidobacteraceae bacterium]